jgi:hypothetical protein
LSNGGTSIYNGTPAPSVLPDLISAEEFLPARGVLRR